MTFAKRTLGFLYAPIALFLLQGNLLAENSKEKAIAKDNTEVIELKKDEKIIGKIIYFYKDNLKVRGEYWEAIDKKDKDKKENSNIFADTAVAKKYEAMLAEKKIKDESEVNLNIEKDGFRLKSVRIVNYNEKGLPVYVICRGYTSYPVMGVFILKTDYSYKYDTNGRLIEIEEKNINVDSLLLNMAVANSTKIERDNKGRPISVKKTIGSVPPAVEVTTYSYQGDSDNMAKTVYQKCSVDLKSFNVMPSETITIEYGDNVPWNGLKKYDFSMGKTIKSILIYDEVAKKNKLDGTKFMKMSFIEKSLFAKNLYDIYKNEQKGPKWRLGELPDTPEPFMIYKDYKWWE
ncbi:MAG TPA: hypothetical protein PKX79_07940 [Spirochaetota bacterium]|nr:hypothetical protein [Spirochaetota bacterium]HOK92800.1 hypothetical protein [Spirochaetota bacterium]HPP95296.1 hypothetical protein [Spirochaetota bacterium]